jgi:hypothetical protein
VEVELELGGVEIEVKIDGPRGLATLLGVAALAAAVAQELRAPPERRMWRGRLAGAVPYDLRPPTPARLRASVWDRANPSVLVPTAFGVGWSVNFAALAERCGCLEPRVAEPDAAADLGSQPAGR